MFVSIHRRGGCGRNGEPSGLAEVYHKVAAVVSARTRPMATWAGHARAATGQLSQPTGAQLTPQPRFECRRRLHLPVRSASCQFKSHLRRRLLLLLVLLSANLVAATQARNKHTDRIEGEQNTELCLPLLSGHSHRFAAGRPS